MVNLISSNLTTQIDGTEAGGHWVVQNGVYVAVEDTAFEGKSAVGGKIIGVDGHLIGGAGDGIGLGQGEVAESGDNFVSVSEPGSIFGFDYGIFSQGGGFKLVSRGHIESINFDGVFARDGGNSIDNFGTITAGDDGVDVDGVNNRVINTGAIFAGADGIEGEGGTNTVANNGTISAEARGMVIAGGLSTVSNTGYIAASIDGVFVNVGFNIVENSGDIRATTYGIYAEGQFNTVANAGSVVAAGIGVFMNSDQGTTSKLINSGEIIGTLGVSGGAGNDTIVNKGFIDKGINMQAGDDTFSGSGGSVAGTIDMGSGNDTIKGGAGDDEIVLGLGKDKARGKAGDDVISGGDGSDIIRGNAGDDDINGGAQNDVLYGGTGDDILSGKEGKDRLFGGAGDDELAGGSGADRFVFAPGNGFDVITDFQNDLDKLDLKKYSFASAEEVISLARDAGGDTVIELSDQSLNGGQIILEDFDVADLDAADLLL